MLNVRGGEDAGVRYLLLIHHFLLHFSTFEHHLPQYWLHRIMHKNRYLYRKFHSVHHRLTVPYAFGALYNHPVEGFCMDSLGGAIPSLLLNMHPWTSTLFFCLATLKTVDDHCGYAWPWDPLQFLFSNNAKYHDIHHWGKGRMYNFSQVPGAQKMWGGGWICDG